MLSPKARKVLREKEKKQQQRKKQGNKQEQEAVVDQEEMEGVGKKLKKMNYDQMLYGLPHMWTLSPERDGAHNDEGQGFLAILQALKTLPILLEKDLPGCQV